MGQIRRFNLPKKKKIRRFIRFGMLWEKKHGMLILAKQIALDRGKITEKDSCNRPQLIGT